MNDVTKKIILRFFIDDLRTWAKAVKANIERPRPDLGEILLSRLDMMDDFVISLFIEKGEKSE